MNQLAKVFGDIQTIRLHQASHGWKSAARLLHSREAPPFFQFIKYGICGVGAVVVHNATFILFASTLFPAFESSGLQDSLRETNSIFANLLAWPIGNLFAYFSNSLWVFVPGRHSKWREFGLFTAISLVSFVVGLVGGPILISEGLPVWIAQIGFIVTAALVNFICRKFLVFAG